jgi:hypothetical protein
MLRLTIGSNAERVVDMVEESATPKEVLVSKDIDFSVAQVHLDGAKLSAEQMNMSFAELGVTSDAMLFAVVKTDNN